MTEEQASGASPLRAISAALGVTAIATLVIAFAFQAADAGSLSAFGAIGVTYLVFGIVAVVGARRRGALAFYMPKSGDFTIGALVAVVLYAAAMGFQLVVMPEGHARVGWIMRVYALLGDPRDELRLLFGGAVFVIGVLEEVTWRGLVFKGLERALGTFRAAALTTVLFAAAHIPTVFLLSAPTSGPNPLLVVAALGCGMVWVYLTIRMKRMTPALFAHGLFVWAVVEFPLWRPF